MFCDMTSYQAHGRWGLQDVFQLLSLGTNAKVIQNSITICKAVLGRAALLSKSLSNGSQMFIASGRLLFALEAEKKSQISTALLFA